MINKINIVLTICTILAGLAASNGAIAAKAANNGKTDARLKHIVYNERDVTVLHTHYRYSTHVILSKDEVIDFVSLGDSLAWSVEPRNNHLFIRPMEDNADTNMTVMSTKPGFGTRIYNFELRASEATNSWDKSLSFAVAFKYPQEELAAKVAAQKAREKRAATEIVPNRKIKNASDLNLEYSRRGGKLLAPVSVFDDGLFTFFHFPDEINTPAIFLVNPDGTESIVNYHVKGKYIVVQRLGGQFILRDGNKVTCIYNDKYLSKIKPSRVKKSKITATGPVKIIKRGGDEIPLVPADVKKRDENE